MRKRLIAIGYVFVSSFLVLFSYTQVDLNLTLSRVSIFQRIEEAFQHVGYYQRPLATAIYCVILILLFTLYIGVIRAVRQKVFSRKALWRLIFAVAAIMVFSYPAAFSYDFFNYMFTAKTVLVYHQNPYVVTPLQFAGVDPWTNFMRWTHLTTAYAPLWIGMTLVPYVLGLGYFVFILFNIKFLVAGFYLLCGWAIVRSMEVMDKPHVDTALAVYALNPLILIESLVSAHNDIVMMAFAMLAVYAYVRKDRWTSYLFLSASVAAKLMTGLLFPVFFLRKNRGWMAAVMMAGVAMVLVKREFLPWYWVWVVPFVALLPDRNRLIRFAGIVSFGLVLSYAPYLFFGDYSAAEQIWKTAIIWSGVGLGAVSVLVAG